MAAVMSEDEVAALLDCEPKTVQEKARMGELPGVKFGRSWRFPKSALLEALHNKALANKPKPQPTARYKPGIERLPPRLPNINFEPLKKATQA